MKVAVSETDLPDVLLVEPGTHRDERGVFTELFRRDTFEEAGLPTEFVQLNLSGSVRGVVRGLHFQWSPPMGKLMRVARGRAFLVAVDIRKGSPALGEWFGVELSAEDLTHVWAPAGFARGFCALGDYTEIEYLCTATYDPDGESGIAWDDPDVGVEWPVDDPILSDRDRRARSLEDWLASAESDRFVY